MRTPSKASSKEPEPLILQLARKSDLDQETAYTICRLINVVGWSLTDDWDWNWLNKKRRNYRSLIDFCRSILLRINKNGFCSINLTI